MTIYTGWKQRMGRCLLLLWRFFNFLFFLHFQQLQLIFPLSYFQIGYESNGDPLFVARGRVVKEGFSNSSMSVGKMNPRYGLAYLPYGGEVVIRHPWSWNKTAVDQTRGKEHFNKFKTIQIVLQALEIIFQEVEVTEYEVLCMKPICDLC